MPQGVMFLVMRARQAPDFLLNNRRTIFVAHYRIIIIDLFSKFIRIVFILRNHPSFSLIVPVAGLIPNMLPQLGTLSYASYAIAKFDLA